MSNYLVLIILLSCSWVFAHEQDNIKSLSEHPHWHKLLHYSKPLFRSARSDIVSKDHFLAKDGATNPESELKATIEGLKTSPEVYCKYPSRRMWLEKMGLSFPLQKCRSFEEWTRGHSVKSVSLIFASGFLGNPASYFGHPLLKFNYKDQRSPLDLLDTAINYGAFTPQDVGALPYAIYGIFGGYTAGFTSADFFFHRNNYSELELRDLWEYELAFSQEQVEELVAHVWEMQNAKIKYYFLDDNCAFRMGELLELVIDKELVSKKAPYAIPSSLFHKIYEYSLFKDIKHLKSRQGRLTDKVFSLNKKERHHLQLVSLDPDHLNSSGFKSLSVDERSRVSEAALDYFSYRLVMDQKEPLKEAKRKVLKERLSLPPQKFEWKKVHERPPHDTQRPILTRMSFFHSEKFGDGGSFRIRPAFYDLISPDAGRPPYSSLSVFDIDLHATDERLWLQTFKLISVETLNLSKTGLEGDGGFAWRFSAGADQLNLACNTCTVPNIEAGGGKAWELSDWAVIAFMIDPRLQSEFKGSGFISVRPNVSTLLTFSDNFRVHAVFGRRFYFNSAHTAESIYHVEGRVGSSRTWDVRLSFQEHLDRRYVAGVGFYW